MLCKSEIIKHIIEIGKRLSFRNYSPGYSGNISARFNDRIIITATGSSNGYLTEADLVEMDFNARPLVCCHKEPSCEKLLHLAFYKKRPDINSVIHVHPAGLSAFASAGYDLMQPAMAENVFYFGGIPIAPYALPASEELAEKTSAFFDKYDAVLMANHGIILGGHTLDDAYQKLEMAEEYAKTVIYARILGNIQLLKSADINKILTLKNKA